MAKKDDQKKGSNFNDMDRFNRYLNKIINDIMVKNVDIKSALENTPFQNGISIKFDESGMPIIEGINSSTLIQGQIESHSDDMLIDIIERSESVIVDATLQGVNAEGIKIETTNNSLHIMASSASRHYDKKVDLPASVDPASGKAVFNNGVLEVTLKKASSPKGINIEIK